MRFLARLLGMLPALPSNTGTDERVPAEADESRELEGEDADDECPSATNSPVDNRLLEAAWEGDVERVSELVTTGANVECFDKCGDTPLHLAIENLHVDVVRVLLDSGADVNRRTASGYWTPLAHAADSVSDAASQLSQAPDNELIRLLVRHGADLNAPTSKGDTPLDILRRAYLNREGEAILVAAGAVEKPRG
jgi:ankyrin repeat protein